jgi:predicted transposase/invertase (TIGR01784 family)
MRRDSIFYQLFRQSPALLFNLVPDPPVNADSYRFDSVAVKEPRFEIDGVFLPPEGETGAVFFVEVQFQKDEQLYERIFAESAPYFYRSRDRFSDWQVVVIYPSRKTEQSDLYPHRSFLGGGQVHRIYLDELGDIRQLPIWVGLMVLTTVDEAQAPTEAKQLLSRSYQEMPSAESRVIIDMVVTIISYRFGQITRRKVEKMLDITFEETKVYQEIKAEGETDVILRQLRKRFGPLEEDTIASISALPLSALEELSEALLDFSDVTELQSWLTNHSS